VKLGTETGSVMNHLMSGPSSTVPVVGMGATVNGWSDRYAGTITTVAPGRTMFTVQQDHAKRTDSNGMSDCQSYEYSPNPEGRRWTFKKNKKGQWREVGLNENGRWVFVGGCGCTLGVRKAYHDFSF
jgi:hypothetical protein